MRLVLVLINCKGLKQSKLRLGTLLAADNPDARAIATKRDKLFELNMSYGSELITCEVSVYFDSADPVQQLMEKLFFRLHIVKNTRTGAVSKTTA